MVSAVLTLAGGLAVNQGDAQGAFFGAYWLNLCVSVVPSSSRRARQVFTVSANAHCAGAASGSVRRALSAHCADDSTKGR
jgi:hypothetical protein